MSNIDTADKNFIAGSSAVAGGAIVHNVYHRGHLTGRETFYHGTRPSRVKDILDNGIHASSDNSSGGVTEIVENFNNNKGGLGSGKLSFLARDKLTGRQYSYLGSHFDSGNVDNIHRFTGVHGAQARNNEAKAFMADHFKKTIGIKPDEGLITASIPTWKKDSVKLVDNPEVALGKKNIAYIMDPAFKAGIDNMERNSVAVEGGVSSKYLKGSKHYVKNSLGEVVDYVKHNPKRFITKGLGTGGLGVGLMAGGTALAAHTMKKEATVGNIYLEKLAEIAEDKGHTLRRPRSTAAGATASVATGAAVGLGAGHALNKVHDKAVTNAEDIIRSKGADAIGNAGRAQKEHVAQALFRDAEILNLGADSVASKAGALSKLRGRLALGGAALGGAAYAAHRLTEKKAEDSTSISDKAVDGALWTASGTAAVAVPTLIHAGAMQHKINKARDARLASHRKRTAEQLYHAGIKSTIADSQHLSAEQELNRHVDNGRGNYSNKDDFKTEYNRLSDVEQRALEKKKLANENLRKIKNSSKMRTATIEGRYGMLTGRLVNRVRTSMKVGAGLGLGAYAAHSLTEKKAEEEAKKFQPVNPAHKGLLHNLEKLAAWGIFAKDSYGDILSRTPGGIDSDYKRTLSQMHELSSRKTAPQVNAELEKLHMSIKSKGLENTTVDDLEKLVKLRKAPVIDTAGIARKNNMQAMSNVLNRGATPHTQWYSGTHPSKFRYLVGVNLENMKKLKRIKK